MGQGRIDYSLDRPLISVSFFPPILAPSFLGGMATLVPSLLHFRLISGSFECFGDSSPKSNLTLS